MKLFHRDQVKNDPAHLLHIRDTLTCLAEHAGKAVEVRIDFKAPPEEDLGVDYEALEEFTGLTLYGRLMMKVIDLPDGEKMPSFGVLPFIGPEGVEAYRRRVVDGNGMLSHCVFALEQVAGIEVLNRSTVEETIIRSLPRFLRRLQPANRGDHEEERTPQLCITLAPTVRNKYREDWIKVPNMGRMLDGLIGGGKL